MVLKLYDVKSYSSQNLARSTQHARHNITLDHFVEVTIVACSNHSFVSSKH
jgi:hypothetical protein